MDTTRLAELLRQSFEPVLGSEDIDLLPSEAGDALDIVTEDWTLLLEGWPDQPVATVSTDPSAASRDEVMAYEIDEAFAYVDAQVDGALTTALKASGDPVSLDLLEAMAVHKQRFLDSHVQIERVAG